MSIFIYWNYKDNDSKKIYSFLNNSEFIQRVKESEEILFCKEVNNFDINDSLKEKIAKSDLILFFTHGEEDAILKFRYSNPIVKERFIFINKENADLLAEKKVIAICCNSAKELGMHCMSSNVNCTFYIGFMDDITYDEGFKSSFKTIVYKTYSEAFSKALVGALNNQWTAQKFVLILRKYIVDMMTQEILSADNRALGSISQSVFHKKTASSLVVLGDAESIIFA